MSNVKIEFRTNNAAFRTEDETLDEYEVAGMVRVAADKIMVGHRTGRLIDSNGNDVGGFVVEED